jgi:DNA-binding response OmpR family regulator
MSNSILVVEDIQDLCELLARELRQEGYHVRAANSGEQALTLFSQQPPDLVILDWMLPGISGLEVMRQMRQQQPGDLPILMLTARGEEIDRVLGLELGADDYMSKPFSIRELLSRIRALLRRSQRLKESLSPNPGLPESIVFQTLVLNPQAYLASLEGADLNLSRTEFDLLCLFVQNPRRVYSRTYLVETVWKQEALKEDRSVDSVVVRLRKKLGALGEHIETVWGVGYRFRP